jgi:hypothetical protein
MKQLFLTISLIMTIAGNVLAADYCRKVATGGMFGQPKGERDHCVTLDEETFTLTDNASSFFGNPPEAPLPYQISGNDIFTLQSGQWVKVYEFINGRSAIINDSGAVLKLQKNVK